MKNFILTLLVIISCSCFAQQHEYTFVFLNKKTGVEKTPEEQVKKLMEGHHAARERLAKEGRLLAAGPFQGGGGMYIMSTNKTEEAKEWISADPAIKAGRWNVEVLPYTSRTGPVCRVGEKYEMTDYSFIRFSAVVSKFTAATYPQIIRKHDEYLKKLKDTGNVVSEGIFGDNDGGIVIMKGDVQKEIFESDPGVQEGLIELDIKKLFIAKGSFCEK